jgi:hypothetical protein
MSVDFYVAMPGPDWPTASAVQQCMVERAYPVALKRFPALDAQGVVTDGASVILDGNTEVYLESSLFPAKLAGDDMKDINERIAASSGGFRIKPDDAVMSFHTRSPAEARAAIYVISGLIVCFQAYGFEPQGNEHGRDDFAKSLIDGAAALKGVQ